MIYLEAHMPVCVLVSISTDHANVGHVYSEQSIANCILDDLRNGSYYIVYVYYKDDWYACYPVSGKPDPLALVDEVISYERERVVDVDIKIMLNSLVEKSNCCC